MSRCFPFPPPGYEKKARPDDENLLAKDKHKEKKHKKEKKDRERSKDKKDKERSEEKHREKKDRKEKHKDKKEKRSKDKDKGEKKKTSDSRNIAVLPPPQPKPENHNGEENLSAISTTTTDKHKDKEENRRTSDNTNITLLPLPDNRNGEKNLHAISTTTLDKHKDKGEKRRTSDNTNITLLPLPKNRFSNENLTTTDNTTELEFLFELGQRNRDSERATENSLVDKINLLGQRSSVVESNIPNLAKGNDFAKAKREEDNGKNQKQSSTKDMEIDPIKRNSEKQMAEKESKRKHGSESKKEKHKDKDREKKSKSKDKKKEKKEKKEKEEKTKDKKPDKDPQQQIIRKEISKDNAEEFRNKDNAEEFRDIRPPSEQPIGIILGKRKEQEINGFLPDSSDIRPNKFSRLATSSPQIVENGSTGPPQKPKGIVKNLKPNGVNISSVPQVAADNVKTVAASVWQGTVNNLKLYDKVSPSPLNLEYERISDLPQTSFPLPKHSGNPTFDNKALIFHTVSENGRKQEFYHTASSTKPGVSDIYEVDEKSGSGIKSLTEVQEPSTKPPLRAKGIVVEARPPVKKPPHPDLKYLSQILTVPSVEWSDFDDQQWLFGNKDIQNAENTRSGPSQVEETQVWAEALRMESADITALPYVIPY